MSSPSLSSSNSAAERLLVRARSALDFGFAVVLALFVIGYYWTPPLDGYRFGFAQDMLFYSVLIPLFWLSRGARVRRIWKDPIFLVVLLLIVQLMATSRALYGPQELSAGQVWLYCLSAITFLVGVATLSRREMSLLCNLIIVSATALAVFSWVRFAAGRDMFGRLQSGVIDEHPTVLAHFLGVACVLCLPRIYRTARSSTVGTAGLWAYRISFLVLAFASFLTQSRTVALGIVLLVLATAGYLGFGNRARWNRTVLVGFVVLAGLLGLLQGPANAFLNRGDAGRSYVVRQVLERANQHAFLGTGLATSDDVPVPDGLAGLPPGTTVWHPHNFLVAQYLYGGVVGVALLLLVLVLCLGRCLTQVKRHFGSPGALFWATPCLLFLFGVLCLLTDLGRLVYHPRNAVYLLFWLPVGLLVASGPRRKTPSRAEAPVAVAGPLTEAGPTLSRRWLWVIVVVLVLLAGQRLLHLGPEIDQPHTWRQSDTAHYARAFFEDGIDLFKPSVVWMGNYRTVIFEFPLPEAFVALAYHAFGERLLVARLVFLAFALGSAWFFFLVAQRLTKDRWIATWALVLFLASPLSLFFSRAVHIDFSVLFFVHAMTWCFLAGLQEESPVWLWLGSIFATFALVIKAPYLVPVAILLVALAIRDKRVRFVFRNAPAIVVPALVFLAWQMYVHRTNAVAPDWSFIPDYRRFDNNFGWYFGSFAQRLSPSNWLLLVERHLFEVAGATSLALAAVGLVAQTLRSRAGMLSWPWFWILGTACYLAIFFNLNLRHDYYQLPMVAPVALLGACGICALLGTVAAKWRGALMTVVLAVLLLEQVRSAERQYYDVLEPPVVAGDLIQAKTPPDALVVVSWGGLDSRSPHVLYRAHRYGWSIKRSYLSRKVLGGLEELGATHLALVGGFSASRLPEPLKISVVASTVSPSGLEVTLFDLALLNELNVEGFSPE